MSIYLIPAFFHPRPIRGIIHIGAHKGQELEVYHRLGVKHLLLIEPIQSNYESLLTRCKKFEQKFSSLVTVRTAVGNSKGKKKMYVSDNDKESSSILKPAKHLVHYPRVAFDAPQEEVNITRLEDLLVDKGLKESHYNMLCVDTQGYELEVLKGAQQMLAKHIDYVLTEVSRDEYYENGVQMGELNDLLQQCGFERLWILWRSRRQSHHGDALYAKNPHPLQKRMSRVFALNKRYRRWRWGKILCFINRIIFSIDSFKKRFAK